MTATRMSDEALAIAMASLAREAPGPWPVREGHEKWTRNPGTRQSRKFRSGYVAGTGGWVSEAMHAVSRRRI